jgi:hypothetical protein
MPMIERMRLSGLFNCVLAMGLLGCGAYPTESAAPPGPASEPQSDRLAGLKDCSTPDYDEKSVDCVVKSSDSAKLTVEVIGPAPYTVKVFDPSGSQRQVFVQQVRDPARAGRPEFQDVDGDGRDELVLMTDGGGSGGELYEIWRVARDEDSDQFVDTGSVFGFDDFRQTSDGKFFAIYAHSGAMSGVFRLYHFVADKLVEVVALDLEAVLDEQQKNQYGSPKAVGTNCKLYEEDDMAGPPAKRDAALREAGLDPATAEQRYCAEPWVQNFYRSK